MTPKAGTRSTYHHGDAGAALVRAALGLARAGGPKAVTLRAAARDVGITATAVYRHFATVEELLEAVKARALAMLAERIDQAGFRDRVSGGAIDGAMDGALDGAGRAAWVRLLAGAYVAFACESPGLFAMACHGGPCAVRDLLCARLDRALATSAPPGLATAVWCAAHGTALLAADDGCPPGLTQVLDIVLVGLRR